MMTKISKITLFQQPEQAALVVEAQTNMNGMAKAIGECTFCRISRL